jgi:membrane protein YqaA with SNARE-associated domain
MIMNLLRNIFGPIAISSIVAWLLSGCLLPFFLFFNIDNNFLLHLNAYSFLGMSVGGLITYMISPASKELRDKITKMFKRQGEMKLNKKESEKRKKDCNCKSKN